MQKQTQLEAAAAEWALHVETGTNFRSELELVFFNLYNYTLNKHIKFNYVIKLNI